MGDPGKQYFGKYRGVVVGNADPMAMGRVQVSVPDVLGEALAWGMPCVPWAAIQTGMWAIPPVGASVWVEFEKGDPSLPIWTGGFWASAAEVPVSAATAPAPGGVVFRSAAGAILAVTDVGISIQSGKGASIQLVGPTVSINDEALTIT